MEIRCPSCNKANETSPCQRCGGDLAPLFAIRTAAEAHLSFAAAALRDGQAGEACAHAERSWMLYHSPEAARIAFLGSVQEGDSSAWAWFRRGSVRRKPE